MFVSRDKSKAVVFAVSINFDHWNNLIPRLVLQGLDPEAVYEVSEPMPSNITQSTGMYMIIETEGKIDYHFFKHNFMLENHFYLFHLI